MVVEGFSSLRDSLLIAQSFRLSLHKLVRKALRGSQHLVGFTWAESRQAPPIICDSIVIKEGSLLLPQHYNVLLILSYEIGPYHYLRLYV